MSLPLTHRWILWRIAYHHARATRAISAAARYNIPHAEVARTLHTAVNRTKKA